MLASSFPGGEILPDCLFNPSEGHPQSVSECEADPVGIPVLTGVQGVPALGVVQEGVCAAGRGLTLPGRSGCKAGPARGLELDLGVSPATPHLTGWSQGLQCPCARWRLSAGDSGVTARARHGNLGLVPSPGASLLDCISLLLGRSGCPW